MTQFDYSVTCIKVHSSVFKCLMSSRHNRGLPCSRISVFYTCAISVRNAGIMQLLQLLMYSALLNACVLKAFTVSLERKRSLSEHIQNVNGLCQNACVQVRNTYGRVHVFHMCSER